MEATAYYDQKWRTEAFLNLGRFDQTITMLPPPADGIKVLDLGAGRGHFSQFMVERGCFRKDQIVCTDLSPEGVRMCEEAGFRAFSWDIEQHPIDEKWDVICFLEALEHVFDPAKVLRNICQSLTPTGRLVLSTPNFCHLQWRLKCGLGLGIEYPGNGHISLFNPRLLRQFCHKAGLEVEAERYATRLEAFRFVGRLAARVIRALNPGKFQANDYNYIRTPIWTGGLGEIMIFRCRRATSGPVGT